MDIDEFIRERDKLRRDIRDLIELENVVARSSPAHYKLGGVSLVSRVWSISMETIRLIAGDIRSRRVELEQQLGSLEAKVKIT